MVIYSRKDPCWEIVCLRNSNVRREGVHMIRKSRFYVTLLLLLTMCVTPILAIESVAEEEIVWESVVFYPSSGAKAAFCYFTLRHSDPWFSNPQAYTSVDTYSGTAYYLVAKTDVTDSNGGSYTSGWATAYDSDHVESGTIVSKTPNCTFYGYAGGANYMGDPVQQGSTSYTY